MKIATKTYSFRHAAIIIMCIIFLMNFILSSEYNLLWILLSGGGNIIDYLGESYKTVFNNFQLYRLITYGYTQTAIWHLLANVFGLWYVGIYLEKRIGIIQLVLVYHIGLIIAGITIFVFSLLQIQGGNLYKILKDELRRYIFPKSLIIQSNIAENESLFEFCIHSI